METMKRCPYCGQEILATAKKCRYCGEWLTDDTSTQNVHPAQQSQTDQQHPYAAQPFQQQAYQSAASQTSGGNLVELPQMTPQEALKTCFRKTFVFKGRARRSEFWWFQLFANIVLFALTFLFLFLNQRLNNPYSPEGPGTLQNIALIFVGLIWIVYLIWMVFADLAVCVRRLQDTGRSGWFVLGNFIPLINGIFIIVFIVFCCEDSKKVENEYGPSPKYVRQPENA